MPIVVVIRGERWKVPDLDRIREIHPERRARGSWKYLLGCRRCMTICSDAGICRCCEMPKAARPYDLEGGHERVMPVDEFLADVTQLREAV